MQAQAIPRGPEFYIDGDDRRKVNQRKAAEIAGVTTRTIRNWMRAGRIEFVRTPGGDPRIFVDTLWVRRPEAE